MFKGRLLPFHSSYLLRNEIREKKLLGLLTTFLVNYFSLRFEMERREKVVKHVWNYLSLVFLLCLYNCSDWSRGEKSRNPYCKKHQFI